MRLGEKHNIEMVRIKTESRWKNDNLMIRCCCGWKSTVFEEHPHNLQILQNLKIIHLLEELEVV